MILEPCRSLRTGSRTYAIDPAAASSIQELRQVLSLGGDSSFDDEIRELIRTADGAVSSILNRETGASGVVDYFTGRADVLRLSEPPSGGLSVSYFSGDEANYGAKVTATFPDSDLTSHVAPPRDNSYWVDAPGQRLVWSGDADPTDQEVAEEPEFPVLAEYSTAGVSEDERVRSAIRNLVLAYFQERHGGEIRVGAVMTTARHLLAPLTRPGF